MPAVTVACPKCSRRQEVGASVPPDGLRHACTSCGAAFLVKPPPAARAAAPPPPPPPPPEPGLDLGNDAGNGISLPSGYGSGDAGGQAGLDDPFNALAPDDMVSLGGTHVDEMDLHNFPDPTRGGGDELFGLDQGGTGGMYEQEPAAAGEPPARERSAERIAMPSASFSYDDLVASREEMPRPDDLPAPREDMPLPDDFLAPREDVPRPDDLPAPRESMPLPGDFLAPRESVPRPGDLPIPRESMPLPGDFLAPRDAIPRPGDLPATRDTVPRSGDVLQPVGPTGRPANLPVARGPGSRPPPTPTDAGAGAGRAARAAAPAAAAAAARPAPAGFDPFADDVAATPSSPLAPLDLGGPPDEPHGARNGASPTGAAAAVAAGGGADANFGLELEGGANAPAESMPGPRAINLRGPLTVVGDDDSLPQLSPPTRKQAMAEEPEVPQARRRLLIIGGGAAAVLVVGVVVAFVALGGGGGAKPATVIEALAPELARDHYPAYQRAADLLLDAANTHDNGPLLRAAAAELMLLGVLAHGAEKAKISRAEQLVAALPTGGSDKPAPEMSRARALMSVAKGRGSEAMGHLGPEADTAEGQLVVGLRDLNAGKRDAAATSFKRAAASKPLAAISQYLIGRALEETRPTQAMTAYQAALKVNPGHFGAALGLARLAASEGARKDAVEKLLASKPRGVAPAELAEAHVLRGRAAQAEGRNQDAAAALAEALAVDPGSVAANIALGEVLLNDGKAQEALARFQATGPAGLRSAAGKFGLGGALIATGRIDEGMSHVRTASQESPNDPRGPFHTGVASELASPPDREGAAKSYRAAVRMDPKFLPATLRLAALLQRHAGPQDALAVLEAAEKAGAPAAALQIAWGEALIVAKEPQKAEEVFRKAVTADAKNVPAHLGLAAALEAAGNVEEAVQALGKTLAAIPDAPGVRERLAALTIKAGRPEEAMAHYQAEIASGRAALSVRVAMAKLALKLGRLDEAQAQLDQVVQQNPATPDALFTMAQVWEARGDLGKALGDYRRALRFGSSPDLQFAFGRVLLRSGKESEAMTALEAAASLPAARVARGRALYRRGDYEKALADFVEAVKMAPSDAEAMLWKGLAHDKVGEADKAAEAWKASLRLSPDNPDTHYWLGRYELDKGRVASGVEHLRKAAAKVPETAEWKAEVYFHLGSAEATAGARAAALAAYRKYLTIAPEDAASRPEVEKQIRRLGGK